jgi:hypothetical protein
MRWHEVIHLRVIDQEYERLIPIFTQLLEEIREKENCLKVKLFKRAQIETDVCFHLLHESDNAEDTGSAVGLRLADALKQFGMVNHTVWTQIDQMSDPITGG